MQISTTHLPTNPQNNVSFQLHTKDKVDVKLQLDGALFKDTETIHTVEVAKTFFLSIDPQSGPYFKLAENDSWKTFEEFFTGAVNANFSIENSNLTPQAGLGATLNLRG